jgi:hypothetical protein
VLKLKAMNKPTKPISAKRLAANRANAARSTGPRTPEGKARSAQNAFRHGFTAANFAVVRIEDPEAVANLVADAIARYQPLCSQETLAVERIALAQLSIFRCAAMEAGFFTNCLDEAMESPGSPFILRQPELTDGIQVALGQNRSYWLAFGFNRFVARNSANSWTIFLRYQAQTERLYRRAVEEFERLKALRHELPDVLPNEPTAQPEPQETTPTSSPTANSPEASSAPLPVTSMATPVSQRRGETTDPRSPLGAVNRERTGPLQKSLSPQKG